MLREIVRPVERKLEIRIPQEYVNKEVEILVLPFFEMDAPVKNANHGYDENLAKLFKNALNIKPSQKVDIDALMNEVNDVVL